MRLLDAYDVSVGWQHSPDSQPPTVAAFSPTTISGSSLTSRQRSSIIVHRKSPLLVATPPAITRALAYSHPFILPLNKLAGLLTWTTGDPWQSFLLVAGFWTIVLYSDAIILWAGPIFVVIGLILGMYWRRFSPLSSAATTGEKRHQKKASETSPHQHETLDEIVETLRTFTTRCNILLDPLLELTEFMSTQRTATSATTKPALTTLFIRILFVTPIWIILTLPPFYLITTRRVVMSIGTIILTYHSRPARVSRVILWRSLTVRRICSMITGLSFSLDANKSQSLWAQSHGHAATIATRRRGDSSGVRFTFVIYENQRRWLGIGWTYSLFPSERAPWTDEHLNAVPPKDDFELPEVQGGNAKWRWAEGSEWRIEGADGTKDKSESKAADGGGWIYYDNKWNDGRRGQDGWDRYTRRRKWCRDAELTETQQSSETAPSVVKSGLTQAFENEKQSGHNDASTVETDTVSPAPSISSTARRRRWFGGSKPVSDKVSSISSALSASTSTTSVDPGKITSATSYNPSGTPASRPIDIEHSRNPSGQSGSASFNSLDRTSSMPGSVSKSESSSLRDKEINHAQDRLDRWGTRATGGIERAERELGLGDEVNMGLS
ncbi:PEX28-32 family peroxisomal membrane protein [Aspergillus clavatus NRRL 1]|uniref:Integral peroxisomal membrane protein n=1 Tax=Aspergillus clavatus (strain ATCC 1007 / CBS 513.65 / DSM 816 / NCTC 3887 / NRRL 1 / QM 1276 / 107) TaxID=344612 RepID=A1CDA3_ASPCL|nr:integral peroxisomal membrane protein [Aspergillus clavatus NRRL 1]EAW11830.1 integral peroxisomal membrane protein [Aspergillus clavatus NRRL 1]